jgi:hypothetical protein
MVWFGLIAIDVNRANTLILITSGVALGLSFTARGTVHQSVQRHRHRRMLSIHAGGSWEAGEQMSGNAQGSLLHDFLPTLQY